MATIKLDIKTAVDLQGVKQLKANLAEIQKMFSSPEHALSGTFSAVEIQKTINAVNTLEHALDSAFDVNLNTVNIDKFNTILKNSNMTVESLYRDLSRLGADGQRIFLGMSQATLNMGHSIQKTSKLVQDMKDTFMNTVRWGITSSLWNNITGSVSKAFSYVKGLDKDLNSIRIVTGKSADQMERFAKQANKAAKELAVSTRDYVQGTLIYYQQGDDDATAQAKAAITAKASNVTGQDMSSVSEQLTAVWNGYQVANEAAEKGMQVYEEYVDKIAAVGAATASDLEEQATAMSKVASAASAMGVEFDQLNAQIATIISVTRQAPESVGNALKTVYARLGDLKVDGVDEFGVSLGEISSQLQVMGIEVLKSNGDMRDMGEVVDEVGQKWGTWTEAQKQAAAVAMAGKRQYNNLIALFDNWDMYGDTLKTSMEATGTLSEQQNIALDSLENKMEQMQVAAEKFYDALFNEKSLGGFIEFLTGAIDLIGSMVEGMGGLGTILPVVGGLLLKNFSSDIGRGIATKISNAKERRQVEDDDRLKIQMATKYSEMKYWEENGTENKVVQSEQQKNMKYYKELMQYKRNMTQEELNHANALLKQANIISQRKVDIQKEIQFQEEKNSLLTQEYNLLLQIMDGEQKTGGGKTKQLTSDEKVTALTKISTESANIATVIEDALEDDKGEGEISFFASLPDATLNDEEANREALIEKFSDATAKKNLTLTAEQIAQAINIQNNDERNAFIDTLFEGLNDEQKKSLSGLKGSLTKQLQAHNDKFDKKKIFSTVEQALRDSFKRAEDKGDGKDPMFSTESIDKYIALVKKRFNELIDSGKAYKEATVQILQETDEKYKDIAEKALKAANAEKQGQEQDKQIEALKQTEAIQAGVQGIAEAIGTITSAIGAIHGFTSALQAAGDTSVDVGERMKNAMTGFIGTFASVPSIVSGAKNTIESFSKSSIGNFIAKAKGGEGATLSFGQSFKALGTATLIATAAFAAISIGLALHAEKLAQASKMAKRATEAQKKLTEAAKQEKDAMVAIDNELESLNEKYEEQEISLVELRSSIADTCLEYERQDLAMKALISDYNTLNGLIDEAKYKANEKYLKEADKEQGSRVVEIEKDLEKNAKGWQITDNRIDVNKGGVHASDEMTHILNSYGIEVTKGHIQSSALAQAVAEDYEGLILSLSKLGGSDADHLITLIESVKSTAEEYKETETERNKVRKEQIVYDNTKDGINSTNDYIKALNSMQEASKDFIKDEVERAEWAKSELFQILQDNNNTTIAYAYEIAVKVAGDEAEEKVRGTTQRIATILDTFNQSEQNFIYLNVALIQGEDPVEQIKEIISKYQNAIEFNEQNELAIQVRGVLDKKDLTELSQADIDSLFANDTFVEQIGMSQEDFELLNFNTQLSILRDFYQNATAMSMEHKDAAIADQKAIIAEYEKAIEEQKKSDTIGSGAKDTAHQILTDNQHISKVGTLSSDLFEKNDSAATKLIKMYRMSQKEEGDRTNDEQALLNEFAKQVDATDAASYFDHYLTDEAKKLFSSVSEPDLEYLDQLEEGLSDAQNTLVAITGKVRDYTIEMKDAKAEQEAWIKSLDDLHGTYDNLTKVISDYNSAGYITQESLQTLLSMSSEQLQYLEFENGQMTINTELMRSNGEAMIANAQAGILKEMQDKLMLISQGKLAEAGYTSTEILISEANAIAEATEAAKQGKVAFTQLSIANAALQGIDVLSFTEEQMAAANAIIDEGFKRYQMAENAKGSLLSSTRKVDKDDLLKIDEEIDRYWEINHTLQEIEETMSDLKRTQDKLHGKELIQSLKAENELIKEQTKAYEQLYKEQQLEEKDLREQLSHLGVDFYENGGIANYEEAMKAAIDRTNAALQDNTITDESRDRISKQYDKFVDLIKQYDELFTEKMNDTLNKIEENKLLELENNFKAWDTAIELELDLTEGKRQWEDFINEIDNDVKAVFSDLGGDLSAIVNKADLYSGDNGDIAINLKAMQDVMAEIDKLERGEDSDMFASISEGQKTLRELFDKTKASTLSLKDLFAEAWDVYLESIDQSAEKFDKVQEAYENINEQLEHEKELIELIYGTEAYDKISGIYQAQTYNSLSRIESLKTEVDLYQSLYDQAEEGTTEQLSYYEKLQEAQSELNNEATNYINLLKNDYANTINSILKNFETSITGGGTFDDLSEEWNRIQEKSDKYLDSVEGLYEIQKFANTIQDSISAETSLKNQQKLQALYDKELEYLREKENLTQYDLDAAEARYQITLKEIALEEARNSKDSMKLTRGADGNWSYQYVADEENMMNKQQELSDAYNNLYQLSKTAYESNLDSLMQLQNDFVTKSQEIASSQVLTEEQKKEKLEKLQQEYYEDYNLLAQENTLYRNDLEIAASLMLMDLRNQDENNYKAMTETEKGLTDDLRDYNINDYNDIYNASEDTYIKIRDNADKVMGETLTAWNDKAQLMANKWNGDGGESVKALVGNAVSQMGTAIDTLADKTRTGMETAGKEVENLGKNFGTATEEANKLKEKTEELAQTANNELATYKTQVDSIATSWKTASGNVTAALTATEEYFKKLGEYDKDYNFDNNKGGVVTGDTKDVDTGDKTTGGGDSKEHDLPEGSESITLYKDNQGKKADGVFNTKMADYYTAYDQGEYTYVSSSMAGLGSGWIKTSDAKTIENLKYSLAEKQIAERQIAENQKLLRNEGIQFYTDPLGGNSKNKVKGYHISYKDYTDMYGESAYAYWATVYDASNKEISSGWTNFNGRKPFSFDTGGYTGAWGSEGKLAVLHEKELVLNKTDTQNILNIVSMVRGLEQGIMGKISSMLAGLSGLNSNMYIPSITGDNNSSNNIFHITAEFPNADDVISIKEAILSLPNIASQYISENKK